MQHKTTGIVLHTTKYNDVSSIVCIYTKDFGRISYMVYGVGKKKSVVRSSFLLPLTLTELEVNHITGRNIQQIKEIRILHPFNSIPMNPIKNSLAMFLSEVLFRSLRQTEPDETLFNFLENSIQQLDYCHEGVQNFHLVFLQKLTRYLGFEANMEVSGNYFDLMNGVFLKDKPMHVHFLMPENTIQFINLLNTDYSTLNMLILSRENRTELLKNLLEYYRLHIPEFHNLHSLAILQSLFD
ncbi:MAG: DNA repair protein RecO [Paludibacter sp.]